MKDLEKSKKLVLKLFVFLCFNIFAIQLDLLAQNIVTVLYSLVIGSFLQFLCMEKVLTANFYQLSLFFS